MSTQTSGSPTPIWSRRWGRRRSARRQSDPLGDDRHRRARGESDLEPSLGWTSGGEITGGGVCGFGDDLEDEHDGSEPEDGEPLLGAFEAIVNQEHAWHTMPDGLWSFESEADEPLKFFIGPSPLTAIAFPGKLLAELLCHHRSNLGNGARPGLSGFDDPLGDQFGYRVGAISQVKRTQYLFVGAGEEFYFLRPECRLSD